MRPACETRQILDELPPLSDKITIEEVNFVLDGDRAAQYGIDRVPAIAVAYEEDAGSVKDSRIRFLGTPAGYEFISLVQAILLVGGARVDPVRRQPRDAWRPSRTRSRCRCSRRRR